MRLTSEVQVVSRLCPTLNIKTSAKAVRCQLAIGKKPASADKTIFIMISTTQNLSGHFYKVGMASLLVCRAILTKRKIA